MNWPARNVSFATVDGLAAVMERGTEVTVRGQRTRELLHRVTVLERPLERFVFVPGRRNDPFAQIAEAIWVMAGRNDIDWLSRYLPRAGEFSDDGSSWRGGYGPRLRRWRGAVDQFNEVRNVLLTDPTSRRAVMTLFDPEADFVQSLDVPCNNWLSWIVRDGRLHLALAVRSNDAVWGFSGANAFEWSVLHEAMAYWTRTTVGRQTWIAASFHVYERHWDRADAMIRGFHGLSPYDYGVRTARFAIPFENLDRVLEEWFAIEAAVYKDPDAPLPAGQVTADPFLFACLGVLRVRWGAQAWPIDRLRSELAALPMSDVVAAAWEYLARTQPGLLTDIPHPGFAQYLAGAEGSPWSSEVQFKEAVKRLHARKDRAYGAAWKRRGELVSVLPNVARKVDRLAVFARESTTPGDEALLDTAVDLYVYATKYRLLLEEREPTGLLPRDAPAPFSDHDVNFERLVDADAFARDDCDLEPTLKNAVDIFDELWPSATRGENLGEVRRLADALRDAARAVVAAALCANPRAASAFVATEAGYVHTGGTDVGTGGPQQAPG